MLLAMDLVKPFGSFSKIFSRFEQRLPLQPILACDPPRRVIGVDVMSALLSLDCLNSVHIF